MKSIKGKKKGGILIFLVFVALVLAVLVMYKVSKKKSHENTFTTGMSNGNNVKFVPAGQGSAEWPRSQDSDVCKAAFDRVNKKCQMNPLSDKVACSDYPMIFCDGKLRATGDLDFGGCVSGAVAYSASDCDNPRAVLPKGAYLCGGLLDPCIPPGDEKKHGINCNAPAGDNPWSATNVCYPL